MTELTLPTGTYVIAGTPDRAEVFYVSPVYTSEICAAWLPDDAAHQPLNTLLAHVSVLELDHLAKAAAAGERFTVDPLENLLPRPGWEIETQRADQPSEYALRQLDSETVDRGARRDLLLLLELNARSAIAPFADEPPPHEWVERLRAAHRQLVEALKGEALFEKVDSPE